MSSTKRLPVILLASLLYNAASANLDPSKYTVTFKYGEEGTSWCLGGVINNLTVITASECFAVLRNGDFFNFTSVKAVVGSHESQVERVRVPKYRGEGRAMHDFAYVELKESLNLPGTGLKYPSDYEAPLESSAYVNKEDDSEIDKVRIVDPKYCPSNDDISFHDDTQLCVELPSSDDRCSHQLGSPLADKEGRLIGVYLDCYDDSAHEIFAKVLHSKERFIEVVSKTYP